VNINLQELCEHDTWIGQREREISGRQQEGIKRACSRWMMEKNIGTNRFPKQRELKNESNGKK
jgi:hypothetical protein